jgi:hypothetical protein
MFPYSVFTGSISIEEITVLAFAACNSLRIVAYIPQIWKAAIDTNGAPAISTMTWTLFLVAHLSAVAYALVNLADWGLAACFAANAVCCAVIITIVCWKRHTQAGGYTQTLCVAGTVS